MKKLIIFLILFLTSCTVDIGDVRHRTLIITDAAKPLANENRTVYIAKSYYKDSYSALLLGSLMIQVNILWAILL